MRRWLLPFVALMGAVASTLVARDWLQARSNRSEVQAPVPETTTRVIKLAACVVAGSPAGSKDIAEGGA